MPEIKTLSDNLKKIRKTLNESQIEFAAHCGISTEILSLLERERSDPKLSTLQKIAAYTNISVSDLLSVPFEHNKNYIYRTCSNLIVAEDNTPYTVHGIEVLQSIPNISTNFAAIEHLVTLCNEFSLSPIHLNEVIDSFFADQK